MPKKVNEENPTINNSFFSQCGDKVELRVAGILKRIEAKETPYGTADRFRGDFAVEAPDQIHRVRNAFFPGDIRNPLLAAIQKVGGKWSSLEFVMTCKRSVTDDKSTWAVSFDLMPRVEQPRVIALLEE